MMLKVLNQIKLRLLHLMGTSMVVQWPVSLSSEAEYQRGYPY